VHERAAKEDISRSSIWHILQIQFPLSSIASNTSFNRRMQQNQHGHRRIFIVTHTAISGVHVLCGRQRSPLSEIII
jgi:hypothetical protein